MTERKAKTASSGVEEAIADLAGLRSSDPAARHAVRAIRLTRLTLEQFWLRGRTSDDSGAGK
jgi:hypothetical protein